MQRILAACLLLAALIPTSLTRAAEPKSDPPRQAKISLETPVRMDYLLYLPKDYDSKDQWPLLLFLHGAGERGHDLEQVKRHGPPKLIDAGKDFPFIVVSPQCPTDARWDAQQLSALIDAVEAKYHVDKDRIYVTGLSMGGYGTWALAAHQPERLAAIVPICGGGDPSAAPRLAHLPIWVFHGAKDQAVPLKKSQEMVDALKKAGSDVKFTIYPDAGHDSWTETYNNPELYEWLLKQKRSDAK